MIWIALYILGMIGMYLLVKPLDTGSKGSAFAIYIMVLFFPIALLWVYLIKK